MTVIVPCRGSWFVRETRRIEERARLNKGANKRSRDVLKHYFCVFMNITATYSNILKIPRSSPLFSPVRLPDSCSTFYSTRTLEMKAGTSAFGDDTSAYVGAVPSAVLLQWAHKK